MTKLSGKNQVDTLDGEVQVSTQDQQFANATPDYKALSKQIAEQGQLKIALLFGLDGHSTNPSDAGRRSYEYFQNLLEKSGFERERGKNIPTGPFTEYVRPASNGKYAVRVSLSLSASDVNTPIVFARRARNAFENYDIVDYVGHSGLGGNLDLAQIARLSSPDPSHPLPIRFPHKYQILFLNSCASFFFYSREYSHLWVGAKHMDLMTNGVATYFHTQNHETVNFLDAFINPHHAATWLEIMARIEDAHPQFHYMINVMPLR